jgi:transposase-like protein
MTSTKNNSSPEKTKTKSRQRPSQTHTAMDKAQAVLAVWTERCRPAEVCRQMNITGMTLAYWQKRAMEGILQALESRVNLSKGEALSPRLQTLLLSRALKPRAISKRLQQIQLASTHEQSAQT